MALGPFRPDTRADKSPTGPQPTIFELLNTQIKGLAPLLSFATALVGIGYSTGVMVSYSIGLGLLTP